jgi:excisionase family DNA binding protein
LPTSEPSGDIPSPASVLTVEEASRQLRISRWSLYKLINARKLKTFKIGHRRLITSDAVADLIKYLQEEGF